MNVFRLPRPAPAPLVADWRSGVSLVSSTAFVAVIAGVWASTDDISLAVYALSFWHYLLYVLAFAYRSVPMEVFRRDAMLMRTVSLTALVWVYFAAPIHATSLLVAFAGFGLNAAAVRALGTERTYYGHELDGLPPQRITAFPYSVMSHPMLIGNMLAFGGLLLHPHFRADWWPLAAAHVLLNGAVILMEAYGRPIARKDQRPMHLPGLLARTASWALVGAVVAAGMTSSSIGNDAPTTVIAAAAVAAYANALFEAYSTPKQ